MTIEIADEEESREDDVQSPMADETSLRDTTPLIDRGNNLGNGRARMAIDGFGMVFHSDLWL